MACGQAVRDLRSFSKQACVLCFSESASVCRFVKSIDLEPHTSGSLPLYVHGRREKLPSCCTSHIPGRLQDILTRGFETLKYSSSTLSSQNQEKKPTVFYNKTAIKNSTSQGSGLGGNKPTLKTTLSVVYLVQYIRVRRII